MINRMGLSRCLTFYICNGNPIFIVVRSRLKNKRWGYPDVTRVNICSGSPISFGIGLPSVVDCGKVRGR